MAHHTIDLCKLRELLSRFFDGAISESSASVSYQYLFEDTNSVDLPDELEPTLDYLKNIMKRNGFTALSELLSYYAHNRKEMSQFYDRLENISQEECYALRFNEACSMYMRTVGAEHNFKTHRNHCVTGHEYLGAHAKEQCVPGWSLSLPYKDDEVKEFVSRVRGNLQSVKKQKGCTSSGGANTLAYN